MNISKNRRLLIKGLISSGVISFLAFLPRQLLAAWPKKAFQAETIPSAIETLEPGLEVEKSDKVTLKGPKLAGNGNIVWVEASSTLENVESISILVEKNPNPLVAKFELQPGTEPFIYTRIKMRESSPVTALVRADGKLYSTTKTIKVTLGGCGG